MSAPYVALVLMIKVEHHPAYILHHRDYTDSRILIELFTREHGRFTAALRMPKRKSPGVVRPQAFTPFVINFSGKSGLKNLTHYEQVSPQLLAKGVKLFCGLYVNELLQRLLATDDANINLFDAYGLCLSRLALAESGEEDIALRQFEFYLIEELGYAVNFTEDVVGKPIVDGSKIHYRYDHGFRPVVVEATAPAAQSDVFTASEIVLIGNQSWSSPPTRSAAKRLARIALANLLGGKPLQSRELFR